MMKKLLCTLLFLNAAIGVINAQEEINVQGNGISIIGDGTNVTNVADGTDFSTVLNGTSSTEQIFVIQNLGTSPLTVNPSFISGSSDFIISTAAISPVPIGGSTNIGVTFNAPLTTGTYTTQLIIFNSDSDENPYQFNLTAESIGATGPEMDVTGNGIAIVGDGSNVPSTGDGSDFGTVDSGTSSTEQFFVIENNGTLPLTVNPSFIGGSSDFVISTPAISPVAVSGSTTIGITFNAPVAVGTSVGTLFITNNDADENPYQINLSGTSALPVGPEINVQGNGISIIGDGTNATNTADGTDFGAVLGGTASTEQIFVIQNLGTASLTVNPSFIAGSSDFIISTAAVSPVPIGGNTTIGITFNSPVTPGSYGSQLVIFNGDSDENPYTINLTGQSSAVVGPEIDVFGNGIAIIGDGSNVPVVSDGTDFGQINAGVSSAEQIFTIQNNGTTPLTVNPSFISGSSDFIITTVAVSPVPVAGSTTIGITFNAPVTPGTYASVLFISNDDSDENPYQINLTAESIPNEQEIDIQGLGISIAGDASNTPDVSDDTDFDQVDVTSGLVSHTFTIENTGTLDLNLTDPSPFIVIGGADAADFSVTSIPSALIAPAGSTTFNITFNPSSIGVKVATISIANDDSDENPYVFNIGGEGIDANAGTPLLITQYYEGTGNNQWIEVKNVSASTVLSGTFYLALYSGFNTLVGNITTQAPDANVSIGTMAPGEVRLFSNPSAALPLGANLGTATVTTTAVCTFSGDDVILISSNNGITSYANRIDIMGVVDAVTPKTWGADVSFIKGCGTTETPTTTFDATVVGSDVTVNDYIELTLIEVDAAKPDTNIALGTQGIGATTWTGVAWNNAVPDRTRNAIISGTYNASEGSFESCDLTVTGTINLNGGTSNYVEVHNNLSISGTFTIGDTESLYFGIDNEDATITGSITKLETTTSLTNLNDFTYWTSPVSNASISSVFAGTDLNRVFYWDQGVSNTVPGGGVEVLGEWIVASGSMIPVKGYIAEGPTAGTYPLSHTVSFSGTPNNGVVSLSGSSNMVFNNDGNTQNDYNFIGNPYPSGINADTFINLPENSTIDGTLWFWTHNTPVNSDPVNRYTSSDYASYNLAGGTAAASGGSTPNGFVSSGQGFMIRAQAIGPGVIFNNAMRERNNNTQFFRPTNGKSAGAAEKDRVWLNAETTDGGAFNQILVGFFENATDDHDRGYDGIKNGAGWINFYSKIDTVKYGIQGLASFNEDKTVPIGFDTFIDEALTYKISIDRTEGALTDNDIYLVDNVLDIIHDLKVEAYEFDLDEVGNHPNRFTLKFTKTTLGVDDQNLENDFVVSNLDNAFEVRSNNVISAVKVYDIMGRLLIEKSPNQSRFEINTSSIRKGTVLIIKASFENGAEANKKAIKY